MKSERGIVFIFGLSSFAGSALLFLLQPMCAKMLLPCLGGAPNVWTTCMLFFQGGLLAGYAYSYRAQQIDFRRLALLHSALTLVASLLIWRWHGLPCAPAATRSPELWLLRTLTSFIGLPYLVLASAAPLLQFSFARLSIVRGADPYFLYATSNAGSLIGLLAYPFLLEWMLDLHQQTIFWSRAFVLFAVLSTFSIWLALASGRTPDKRPSVAKAPRRSEKKAAAGKWLFLAFVPSSLMLSVTSHLSANLSAVPILWMLPLSTYLITYIVAFSSKAADSSSRFWARWMPAAVLIVMVALLTEATEPLWLVFSLHLLGLFWIGMLCHTELAHSRPAVNHLGRFYLCIAGGGALGGLFNAIVAPTIFNGVWEYPLMLVLACMVRAEPLAAPKRPRWLNPSSILDVILPLLLGFVVWILAAIVGRSGIPPGEESVALIFALPLIVCYTFLSRPFRFAFGVAALLLAGTFYHGVHGVVQDRFRSFFGVHLVTRDRDNSCRLLVHGNTEHGRQSIDPARRREPLAYYHRSGPIGDILNAFSLNRAHPAQIAVVGLGAGSLAAYAQAGQRWTFYEIDPAVIHIARNTGYFTYLADATARGAQTDIVVGDGRLQLAAASQHYDIIILDAFGSDSIPLHLVTAEALAIYCRHLTAGGLLAFHYSSRYLDLRPILARLAAATKPRMICLFREDLALSESDKRDGKAPSKWAVISDPDRLKTFQTSRKQTWGEFAVSDRTPLWTDSSANLLDALPIFRR